MHVRAVYPGRLGSGRYVSSVALQQAFYVLPFAMLNPRFAELPVFTREGSIVELTGSVRQLRRLLARSRRYGCVRAFCFRTIDESEGMLWTKSSRALDEVSKFSDVAGPATGDQS